MQPVQDLTVEDRVSRTQFQYTLEDPNADELNTCAPQMLAKLQQLPELRDVASDQQVQGLRAKLVFDRDTASRLGITPSTIDQTLYDAYGQRQVSTMFTQLNQYHVVLEVKPDFSRSRSICAICSSAPASGASTRRRGLVAGGSSSTAFQRPTTQRSRRVSVQRSSSAVQHRRPPPAFPNGGQVPLSAFTHVELTSASRSRSITRDSSRWSRSRSTWRPNASLGDAVERGEQGEGRDRTCRPASRRRFKARPQAFQASLANEPVLILAALVTVYIVLGVLYESYIHPITILSTLPSAGVGALLALIICRQRLQRDRADRHRPADRHREEERHHDDRFRARRRAQGGHAARGRDLSGLPAALPADHDDHHGGAARRRAAGARHRHRLGTAPAARHHDHRRPDLQPGADALHHAGDLSVLRPPGAGASRGTGNASRRSWSPFPRSNA